MISVSCKKDAASPIIITPPVVKDNKVTFSKHIIEINDAGNTIEFEVKGDIQKYEFLNPSNWVEIQELGSNKFNLLIKPNETSENRSTKIYLLNDKKNVNDSLTIKQSYLNVFLNLSTENINIDKIQPTYYFTASSNVNIQITTNTDWLKIENVRDSLYVVNFNKNLTNSDRNTTIEISTIGRVINITKRLYIKQSSDFGRYSDSLAIQSLNRAVDFIGLNQFNNIRPWPSSTPLNKLNYIETEIINNELRVVGLKVTDYLANFNINLIDSVELLSQLKRIIVIRGLLKCDNFFTTISKNTNIQKIEIPGAKVAGNFDDLYKLTKLKELSLTGTNIGGNFNNNIEKLKDLEVLDFSFTNLNGSLPEGFYNLSSLDSVNFYDVNLTGGLSESISKLKKLRFLQIIETLQKGPLPKNIGAMDNLEHLIIMRTDFEETLPLSLGSLQNIKQISIEHTKMYGEVPNSLVNLKDLNTLNLRYNNFTGEIFNIIYQMPSLKDILLNFNNFSGQLDSRIKNLKVVSNISINNNNFSGTIPKELAELPKLSGLRIDNNRFVGIFPQELLNHPRFNLWSAKVNIFPQQQGYGFSNIN